MNADFRTHLKDFSIWGFTKEPQDWLKRRLSKRLGVVPRVIDYGSAGQFFFYTSYGDVAETEAAIALKLGFARSKTKSPLSAQQLLAQEIVTPHKINHAAVRGNTLIACFSKREAKLAAFKNLVSLPQLYYWVSVDGLIGSDSLRCLVAVLDRVELNPDILPYHFVFRHAPGTLTYFKNVQRLFPGQVLKWQEGNLEVHCAQDLRFPDDGPTFDRVDRHSVGVLYQELKDVVGAYLSDIEKSGLGLGNLLSGGVDSAALQLVINEQLDSKPAASFSFVPARTPSFEFEIDYARQASALLGTKHTFIQFRPEDYPDLIVKAIEILGQPVLSDVEPCKVALAASLAEQATDLRFFFVGVGADTLFGLPTARKLKVLNLFRRVPGSSLALAAAGRLMEPFSAKGLTLSKGAEILTHSNDPDLFIAPTNTEAVMTNLDIALRCFGHDAIRQVLAYRRNWEEQYLDSANYTEKVHAIDLLGDSYEIQVQSGLLFLGYGKEQVYPFMDDDVIRISFAFQPDIRYLRGLRTKPLLTDILEQHGLSTIAHHKRKGSSVFTPDLYAWMRSGPLHEMVRAIDRPDFLSKADFDRLLDKPDHFLWSLLTFDVFQKQVLRGKS
jgi:asparagine synthetase B (glutamine-hydrolysing)